MRGDKQIERGVSHCARDLTMTVRKADRAPNLAVRYEYAERYLRDGRPNAPLYLAAAFKGKRHIEAHEISSKIRTYLRAHLGQQRCRVRELRSLMRESRCDDAIIVRAYEKWDAERSLNRDCAWSAHSAILRRAESSRNWRTLGLGEVAERLNAAVLKTVEPSRVP